MTSPRKRKLLPPRFVGAMLAGHSALGLAFAALIYVVCITGVVSVFMHELIRWEQPDAPVVSAVAGPVAVQTALEEIYRKAQQDDAVHDVFIVGPGHQGLRFFANYHGHPSGRRGHWVADGSGHLVVAAASPWSDFIGALHMNLHVPRTWGRFLVGLIGVALLSSLISGILAHPRIFRDAFALRWGGSVRLQQADIHNRLSVWGLPFHVAVTLTGALLGLSTTIIGVLALAAYDGDSEKAFSTILGPMPTEDASPAPLPDVAKMMQSLIAQYPASQFTSLSISHVAEGGQAVQIGMRTPGHIAFSNTYHFDGRGNSRGDSGFETGSVGQQILGAIQPLHFGWFGGMPIKLAYALLGLALTVITQSGVVIWLARKREKGRPEPLLERAWTAVVWSQPLAFGATALVGLASGGTQLLAAYIAALVAAAAVAALSQSSAVTSYRIRAASAVLLALVPVAHAYVWIGRTADPMAWSVNAAFLLIAACLAWTLKRRHSVSA